MKFSLLAHETPADFAKRAAPKEAEAYFAGWMAYSQAVAQAGIMVNSAGLMPPETATTVKVRNGKRQVQDGPFSDAKEQLGGLFVIEVPDLDTALDWAEKCPAALTGGVEVRPLIKM